MYMPMYMHILTLNIDIYIYIYILCAHPFWRHADYGRPLYYTPCFVLLEHSVCHEAISVLINVCIYIYIYIYIYIIDKRYMYVIYIEKER